MGFIDCFPELKNFFKSLITCNSKCTTQSSCCGNGADFKSSQTNNTVNEHNRDSGGRRETDDSVV